MGEESNSASSESQNKMEDRTSLDLVIGGRFVVVPEKEKTISSQSWYKINNEIAVNLPLGMCTYGGHVFCYGQTAANYLPYVSLGCFMNILDH